MFSIFTKKEKQNSSINQAYFPDNFDFNSASIAEKLNDLNLIITVKNHKIIRLENKKYANKFMKALRIKSSEHVIIKSNNHLSNFIEKIDCSKISDGKWSSKALSKKIRGNSVTLEKAYMLYFQSK